MMSVASVARGTLLLLAGLAAVRAARRARASMRHVLMVATFAGLLALPILTALTPVSLIVVPVPAPAEKGAEGVSTAPAVPAGREALASERVTAAAPTPSRISWNAVGSALQAVWALGALWLASSLMLGIWRLTSLARHGVPWLDARGLLPDLVADAGIRRPVHVVLHEAVSAPLTCGFFGSTIVLPWDAADWSDADMRRALVHELEHVRRGDWIVQVMARLICAAYWFHPLAWRAFGRLCLEAERACDDAVIARGASEDYAEQLVSLASRLRRGRVLPALAMASRGDLSVRVMALLDAHQRRGRAGMRATAVACAAALVFVGALASVRTVRAAATVSRGDSQATQSALETRRKVLTEREREPEQEQEREEDPMAGVLLKTAARGDVPRLGALLDQGADVNAVLDGDGSPLIVAAKNGRLEAARLLLDRGADVNLSVGGDGNPLIMAAREGHVAMVDLLLARGANIDEVVAGDENALIQASGHGRLAVVKLLVARGADVNARVWAEAYNGGGEWRTPLGQARKGGHADVVSFLESSGARE